MVRTRRGALLLVAVGAILASSATASSTNGGRVERGRDSHRSFEQGQYLDAVDAAASEVADRNGTITSAWNLQQWLQALSYVDNRPGRILPVPAGPSASADLAGVGGEDALRAVVARARDHRIVILNEAHDNPRHRAFAIRVARALRPLGYATLAVEALFNRSSVEGRARAERLARDGYPRLDAGIYTREPVFADFLRQSLRLGYRPIAYEQTDDQDTPGSGVAEREQAQAENILAQWRGGDPGDRLLVYVGYNHVAERTVDENGELTDRMAVRLKRMAGLDVLSIDQATLSDTATRSAERTWAHALRSSLPRGSYVLRRRGLPFAVGRLGAAVDLQVVHGRDDRDGRPSWLAETGRARKRVLLGPADPGACRLVAAFIAGEGDGAVPVDVVRAGERASYVDLMVPPRRAIRVAVQERKACAVPPVLGPDLLRPRLTGRTPVRLRENRRSPAAGDADAA